MEIIDLTGNDIDNIEPFAGLINITELRLGGNNISTIESLSGLTNLTILNLNNNDISTISLLLELPDLKKANLRDTNIDSEDCSVINCSFNVSSFNRDFNHSDKDF